MNLVGKNAPREFLPALESARGIAAFMVVIFHFSMAPSPLSEIRNLSRSFYLAVDFFFILSGFILAKNYLGKIPTKKLFCEFLILRLGRIYPLHLFWLIIYLLTFLIIQRGHLSSDQIHSLWPTITLTNSTFLLGKHTNFNPPSWSISAEWISYCVFGLHMLFFESIKKSLNLLFSAILVIVSYFTLFLFYPKHGLNVTYEAGFLRGIGGFYLGFLGFYIHSKYPAHLKGYLKWITLFIAIFLLINNPKTYSDFLLPPLALILVIWLSGSNAQKSFLTNPFFVWIGTISYSVYLGHDFIGRFTHQIYTKLLDSPMGGYHLYFLLVIKIVFCYFVAHLTYKFIEKPYRDKVRALVK